MKWIDSQEQLAALLASLGTVSALAVDTEADSLHSYFDKVCLIQVSAGGEDYLIDPFEVDLAPVGELLASPAMRKVLHGSDYDLRILNRDFGFTIANLCDTMVCAQLLGYQAVGLAALLERHFGVTLDKSHQRADWAQRPLPGPMKMYAAMDTRHLIDLADRLEQDLRQLERWEWALEEFERLEAIRYREPEEDPEAFRKIKGSAKLPLRGLAALARLHRWRDQVARSLDRPPFKVLGNEAMLEISRTLPVDVRDLRAIKGVTGFHMGRWGNDLVSMMKEVQGLAEADLPKHLDPRPWRKDKALERRIERLKKTRDVVAADLKIDPGLLAPRHVLSAIATSQPTELSQLAEIAAMRRWQIAVAGPALLETVQE